jgi:hypothetical protein
MTQGAVILATGILILLHHKDAVQFARVCAILFTIGSVVHGLSIFDIIQVVLVWVAFSWYRSWRIRNDATTPTVKKATAVGLDSR